MIITEKMVVSLGLWSLNYDETFESVNAGSQICFTENGQDLLSRNWKSLYDSEFSISMQKIKEILLELIAAQETTFLFESEKVLNLMSFSDILKEAIKATFKTYTGKFEFYEHVSLDEDDFESIVVAQLRNQTIAVLLSTFKIDFDDILDQLDVMIESKGYIFDENVKQWVEVK